MVELNDKLLTLKKAYASLGRAIEARNGYSVSTTFDQDTYDTLSAGVVKSFEFTFEACWKFLKKYLEVTKDVTAASPKKVFQECYDLKILSEALVNELFELTNIRNNTVHIYDMHLALSVCNDISQHYQAFSKMLAEIKLNQQTQSQ